MFASGGCDNKTASTTTTPVVVAPSAKPETVIRATTTGHVSTGNKADHNIAREDVDIVMQLDIYQLMVPLGAISGNEKFWRHIDEDHVDTHTHALLLKNGIRYGIGQNDDWDYFKGLMDHYGATARKGSTAAVKRGSLELALRTGVESQNIFFLDDVHQTPVGRTYDKCDNLLALTFEPTPRRPGDARIAACALVRGLRKQYTVTLLNETRDIELRSPEYLYDLRLRQDVPLDHFMVIAPSQLVSLPDNLGHTFFVQPGGAEPLEIVLLLVPRPFRITGEAPNVPLNRVTPGNGGK
jgi:hypothetical protein